MQLRWAAALSSTVWLASATKPGHVYVFDSTTIAPSSPPSVDPQTARLILAQRLGVSRYHALDDGAGAESYQHIDTFGGFRQQLFDGDDTSRSAAQVLIWVDDVEDASAIVAREAAHFIIDNPPSSEDNNRLLQDIIFQAESIPKHTDPKARTLSAGIEIETAFVDVKRSHLYNDYLTVFHATKADDVSAAQISDLVDKLLRKASDQIEFSTTVVLMPSTSSRYKRSSNPYGSYELPRDFASQRQKAELLLSSTASEPSAAPVSNNVTDLEDFPTISTAEKQSPVLGILPRCFESKTTCEERTNGCSGHGKCGVLRKGVGETTSDCYGCTCEPTVEHVGQDEGMEIKRRVTNWGGPACQKMDISVPFWLFAGFGVILAFLISAGIGLLYSVGNEELPSVIGAGVSGPVRK